MSFEERIYSFFLSVWLHNAKSLQLKEISPAVDDGGPSEQLKQGVSTDSTPPSSHHAAALHESSVRQYHASISSEEQILFLFLVGLTWQGKIKKE